MVQSSNNIKIEGLLSLIGVCAGGPSDLADNHDQYSHKEKKGVDLVKMLNHREKNQEVSR
jgi:hypothetical protein